MQRLTHEKLITIELILEQLEDKLSPVSTYFESVLLNVILRELDPPCRKVFIDLLVDSNTKESALLYATGKIRGLDQKLQDSIQQATVGLLRK